MEYPNGASKLLSEVLASYKEEYRELSEIWRNLDAKAQGVVAIDGILLAAIFAFVRLLSSETPMCERLMITVTAVLLTVSVGFATRVLWIKSVPAAPLGESLEDLVADLLDLPDGTDAQRLEDLTRDHAGLWRDTNAEIAKVNSKKAIAIVVSQTFLLLALLAAVVLTLYKVWI